MVPGDVDGVGRDIIKAEIVGFQLELEKGDAVAFVVIGLANDHFRDVEEDVALAVSVFGDDLDALVDSVENLVEAGEESEIALVLLFVKVIQVDFFNAVLVVGVKQGHLTI